jgi:hypothetical protein
LRGPKDPAGRRDGAAAVVYRNEARKNRPSKLRNEYGGECYGPNENRRGEESLVARAAAGMEF